MLFYLSNAAVKFIDAMPRAHHQTDMESSGTTPRRTLLVRSAQFLGALIAGGLGIPALAYLFTPSKSRSTSAWVDAAALADLPTKSAEEVSFRRVRMDGWKILSEKSSAWVVRFSDTNVVAYSPECTHLGCAYHWEEGMGEFLCPCHTSRFSIEGNVLSGPAPRPLDRLQVKLDAGRVLIGPLQPPEKGA